jgi:methylmalonyl-CoA/ethylmalonyl-CoA epimerase
MDLNLCFVGTFELLEPRSADGLLGRWLTEHGPGMHHVAYRVPDIEEAMALLEKDGMTWLDSTPRMGAQGHRIAFLHPSSTGGLLMEVVEHP